jgi:hypothetical protein
VSFAFGQAGCPLMVVTGAFVRRRRYGDRKSSPKDVNGVNCPDSALPAAGMTLRTRRLLVLIGALIVAGFLAFPLRQMIYESIVVPVAFIAWNLNLLYRSFSQGVWWAAIFLIVLFMLLFSLIPQPGLGVNGNKA